MRRGHRSTARTQPKQVAGRAEVQGEPGCAHARGSEDSRAPAPRGSALFQAVCGVGSVRQPPPPPRSSPRQHQMLLSVAKKILINLPVPKQYVPKKREPRTFRQAEFSVSNDHDFLRHICPASKIRTCLPHLVNPDTNQYQRSCALPTQILRF